MNNSDKHIEDYVKNRVEYLKNIYNINLDDINISNIINLFNKKTINSQSEKKVLDELISDEINKVFRVKYNRNIVNNQYGGVLLVYLISGIVVIGFILLFIYFLKV
ncbi:MAG: hypothetical protein IKE89_05485 [Bacilli bacterium]|nr:hypothetical protein [Bacilli bacterium]